MMAWYQDIRALTERTPQERSDFARSYSRAGSRASVGVASISSDVAEDDEEDRAFGASAADMNVVAAGGRAQEQRAHAHRLPSPNPGGRFPSDDVVVSPSRGLQQGPLSPDSVTSPTSGFDGSSAGPTVVATEVVQRTTAAGLAPGTAEVSRTNGAPVPSSHPTGASSLSTEHRGTPSSVNGRGTHNESPISVSASKTHYIAGANGTLGKVTPYRSDSGGSLARAVPESGAAIKTAATVLGGEQCVASNLAQEHEEEQGSLGGMMGASGGTSVDGSERPTAPRAETTQTISNLHIPGEYPKGVSH